MEIVHVVLGKANPNRMNGVNKVVYQLVSRQVAAGRKASVWGITADPVHNYPPRNFETRLFRTVRNKFSVAPDFRLALQEKKGKTVFHLHGGFNPEMFAVSKQLHRAGIPFVFTPHGAYNTIAMQRSSFTKWVYGRFFEKKLLSRASLVHCLGQSEVEGLQRFYAAANAALVPYGFESTASRGFVPEAAPLRIGFCGRLDIYTKGLDVLLDAFAGIRKNYPAAELVLIGDGKERTRLAAMIHEKQLEGITLAGAVFGEEKDNMLRQVQLFVHPSRNEGLPAAVLEAAAIGLPLVITEATNMGSFVRKHDCGIVISLTDAAMLEQAIATLYQRLRREGWRTISARAQQMVKTEFNWEHTLVAFDKMYNSAG